MRSTLSRLLSFAEQLTVPSKSAASKSKGKERDAADKDEGLLKELETLVREDESKSASPSGSRHDSPAAVSTDKKTAAEKRFEEVQKKRVCLVQLL